MKAQKDPKIYYEDTQILRFGPDFLKKNFVIVAMISCLELN